MTFGRGGAGNATRPPPPSTLTGTTRLAESIHSTSSQPSHITAGHKFSTGRGGSGNMHPGTDERPMFRFDEELERERLKGEQAPVYHVGRGGQGNAVSARRESSGSEGSSRGSRGGSVEWVRNLAKKL